MNTSTKTCKLTTSTANDNSLSAYLEFYVNYLKDRQYSVNSTTGYYAVEHINDCR